MHKILITLLPVLFFATSFHKLKILNTSEAAEKPGQSVTKVITEKPAVSVSEEAAQLYHALDFGNRNRLSPDVFEKAYFGFYNLKKAGRLPENSHLLTICDFSLSSVEKRLWIIDMERQEVVFNTLVAHGKNTGEEFAAKFSNTESSYQTSLGFYITENTYQGSNGYSLKLTGMDSGYNDAAMQRAIVMHGADYVSEDFIKSQKRLGRSWGCPAVPRELAQPIIDKIKGKNGLFIYYPDSKYLSSSRWLKTAETA